MMDSSSSERRSWQAAPPIPHSIPQLAEHFHSFEQMGQTTGRFGYRQWCYDHDWLGLRRGDIIKIDLRVPPKNVRGAIVWVEIHNNPIETLGVLEQWSTTHLEVWESTDRCLEASLKLCVPRKVLGKLDLEPSQREFLLRYYDASGNPADKEAQRRLEEVLHPRPAATQGPQPTQPSVLTWLFARPKRGRLLDLSMKLSVNNMPRTGRRSHQG